MLFQDVDFLDYAASRIAATLFSVFFNKNTMFGAQFSPDRIIGSAYHFAQKLEESRNPDNLINYFAINAVEGMLFGFYQNCPENKGWTALVHTGKITLFVRDAYRIAEKMAAKSQQMRAESVKETTSEQPETDSSAP